MSDLFQRDKSTISRHIKNIFIEGELQSNSVVAKFATTAADGKTYKVDYYNLDVIISVGYRVKSIRGTQFRIWATQRLKEYMIKGFVMDDERLKGNRGGSYWRELVERIRDIRASEKVIFRQVLDLYATSLDFKPDSEESVMFYKIVQNKLHYAVHGRTAAEIIFERADSSKPFMGLTSFAGELPSVKDVSIAKNYLSEKELLILKNLVSGYFDLAEINAMEHKPMYMEDYIGTSPLLRSHTMPETLQVGAIRTRNRIAASQHGKLQFCRVFRGDLFSLENPMIFIDRLARRFLLCCPVPSLQIF